MIAVITPTIPGRQGYLARCIETISHQVLPPYTHLIQMNYDGCNSMTNYNRLIKKALSDPKVDWIAWCADDDVYSPTHLAAMDIVKKDCHVVYSGYRYMIDGHVADIVCVKPDANTLLNVTNYITNPMIHRSVFERGIFMREDTIDADWLFYKRLVELGCRFSCTDVVTFDYVDHANQTHKKGLDHYER